MFDLELSDGRLHSALAHAELHYGDEPWVAALVRAAAVALHESSGYAAGKPGDALWLRTYQRIQLLVLTIEPLAGPADPCVMRLRSFLDENADLRIFQPTLAARDGASPTLFAAAATRASAKR